MNIKMLIVKKNKYKSFQYRRYPLVSFEMKI